MFTPSPVYTKTAVIGATPLVPNVGIDVQQSVDLYALESKRSLIQLSDNLSTGSSVASESAQGSQTLIVPDAGNAATSNQSLKSLRPSFSADKGFDLGYRYFTQFLSGDTGIVCDGNNGTFWNVKADVSSYGVLDTGGLSANIYMTKIRYNFNGINDYGKRVKYIDLYVWNGTSYVKVYTLFNWNTSIPAGTIGYTSVNGNDVFWTLPTAVKLLDGNPRFGFATREYWGDPYGYRWVSEIEPYLVFSTTPL